MKRATLQAHLEQVRRDQPGPLRVLVLHDGAAARQRVQRLLTRIQADVAGGLQTVCDYQHLATHPRPSMVRSRAWPELIFLAVSCTATLTAQTFDTLASLLPALKARRGALAFLSGTIVPRQLDVLVAEQFLSHHARRAGVDFFSGAMPGLGCPGCRHPRRSEQAGPARRRVTRHCVLHAPQPGRASTRTASAKAAAAARKQPRRARKEAGS